MLQRIGFRRLLPVFLTIVHMLLIALSSTGQDVRSAVPNAAMIRPVRLQEDGAVDFRPMRPKPLSNTQRAAVILNLPALLVGIPIAATVFNGNDLALVYAATPFVPVLWFFVGYWLDVQLGFIAPRTRQFGVLRGVFRGAAALCCGVLLLLSIVAITPINHHRDINSAWIGTGGILWFGLMFVMAIRPTRSLTTQ